MKPFSPEEQHRDSTMFNGQIVEHLRSWLTINPYKGCSLNCSYCFRVRWFPSNNPQQVYNTEESLNLLLNHPDFIPNETPVSINNSSTDCLLPAVSISTFQAIEIMEEKKLTNPFALITKLKFSKRELNFLKNLNYVKPIIFVSLSLIPELIEPTPISHRLENLKNLSNLNLPTVLYFRPIVKGWNDSLETIEKALLIGQEYCDAICIGGLTISKEIIENLLKNRIIINDYENSDKATIIQSNIEKKVLDVYGKLKLSIPLFKHSSCAVSYFLEVHNYNHLFLNSKRNCLESCPISQQIICKSLNF